MNAVLVICFGAILCGAIAKPQLDPEVMARISSYIKLIPVIEKGNVTEVESLIKAGASANAAGRENETVLKFAAAGGNEQIVNLLIQNGADVNQTDFYGFGPLQQAVQNGHTQVVELLIKSGANVNAHDEFNSIPLHYVRDADESIAELLVNAGSDLNVKNIFKQVPSDRVAVSNVLKRKEATTQS